MMRTILLVGCALAALGSCGPAPKTCAPNTLSAKAQLCPDRDEISFAMNDGTPVGTKATGALMIRNGGEEDLAIAAVGTSGAGAFRYSTSWGGLLATTVKGGKEAFVQVEFTPTAEKWFDGTITITSNAQNTPSRSFTVTGCGVSDAGIACP